jgi:raffinose/stachyose/melibiose transport system substrate-binding protein
LITQLLDEPAVKERIAAGKIPPLKNLTLSDPMLKDLLSRVQDAKEMQLWYDQALSPEVSEVHKNTCQELFGLTMTPEAAAQELQTAQERYLRNR